jgi:uncharacterized membrane protein YczE
MFYVYNLFFFIYLCAVLTNNEQYKKSNNNANMEQPFNLVSNTTLKKNVADYTLIVIGAFLQALSYSLFLAPYKIVPGGVYGISIVLHHVTQGLFSFMPEGLPMGATALCFNVPLLLLAMKKLGLASGPKTIVTFVLISIFTDSFSYLFANQPLVENDSFIACFYGGAILGLGVTCVFRAQSTSAGTDDRPKFKFEGKQYDYCHRFDRGDVGVTCIPRLGGASVLLVCYLRIRKGGGNVPDRESKPGGVYRIAENAGGKRTDCRKDGDARYFLAWSRYV